MVGGFLFRGSEEGTCVSLTKREKGRTGNLGKIGERRDVRRERQDKQNDEALDLSGEQKISMDL